MTPASLTAWRARLKWTKVRAAKELGISRQSYADYEAGLRPIPRVVAIACAALALGIIPHP
jgi:DNA-binding XRE family transcriptional regulator